MSEVNIQLSSNSNEGLRLAIESRPTYVGKFRQAYLQKIDRERALKSCQYDLKKAQVKLKSKELDKRICLTRLEEETDQFKRESLELNLEYLAIEMEEISDSLIGINQQINDAFREVSFCEFMIDKVIEESGIDFYKLTEEEFQQFMTEETQDYQCRKLAASLLTNPTQALESLLELTPKDRVRVLLKKEEILKQHTQLVIDTLKPERNSLSPTQPS